MSSVRSKERKPTTKMIIKIALSLQFLKSIIAIDNNVSDSR